MQLTQKLLRYLNSVFDKDARSFVAFFLRHESGAFRWRVAERVLYGYNGATELFAIPLEGYTIGSLLNYLASLPGVTVATQSSLEQLGLSACALMDGEGQQVLSNGDHVEAFTSVLWSHFESLAVELKEAKRQVVEALKQMSVRGAEAEWLDEWGSYFGIPRKDGEVDAVYGPRIIVEVLRPRGNNKAIEIGLADTFGQASRVIDLQKFGDVFPVYDGSIFHDSSEHYDAEATPYYGLFKIVIGYDLLGGADIDGFVEEVKAYVETLRDAGTHLESVELGGSQLSDDFPFAPTDGASIQVLSAIASLSDSVTGPTESVSTSAVALGQFSESLSAPDDAASGSIEYSILYSGVRDYDGSVAHVGISTESLVLS
jgi:hypothetical protein